MDRDIVVAVNEFDSPIGYYDKITAHEKGILHRAVSVFVFNSKNEWLLQKRAASKYHSASLWSNTACSHPMKEEQVEVSARRRLKEEMGLNLPLEKLFSFQYRTEFENGLIENELDHVFIGFTDDNPLPDLEEVAEYKWITTAELISEIKQNPDSFTVWFKLLFPRIKQLRE